MEKKDCIYIKRGPEFLGLDKISSQKMRESIERVLALRTDDNAEEVGILLGKILFGEKNGCYRLDFTGTDDFWIRTDENDKIVLRKAIIDSLITTFSSEEELDEKYISLRDFLEHAEYIGRRFVRTEQFYRRDYGMDTFYTNPNSAPLALYSNGAYILVVEEDNVDDEIYFSIIQSEYLYDSKFKFIDDPTDNYKDKDALYEAIYKQVCYERACRIR